MNVHPKFVFSILFLIVLGTAGVDDAQAQKIQVESATPAFAEQNTLGLDVEIAGKGFDKSAAVNFFVTGTPNPGGITVKKVKFLNPKKLVVTIDVASNAEIDFFDIEVRSLSRGGRGKGTELFQVSAQGSGQYCFPWPACKDGAQGPGLSTCNAVYGGSTCFRLNTTEDCPLVRFNDTTPGWNLMEDCQTSETLVIPVSDPYLHGNGHRLQLVSPWQGGRAAIVNGGGAASVRTLTIVVSDMSIANGSCVGLVGEDESTKYGLVATAISLNPHRGTAQNPRMMAIDNYVTTLNQSGTPAAQFCNAIEYGSNDLGPLGTETSPLFVGGILRNIIETGSYSQFGVLTQYVNTGDQAVDRDVFVEGNWIGYSANGCAGIKVGPNAEKAGVRDNTVAAPFGCAADGVGIDIEFAGIRSHPLFLDDIPITVEKNFVDTTMAGATIAIRIANSAIGKNEGNIITCSTGDQTYALSNNVDATRNGLFPRKRKTKNTLSDGTLIATSLFSCP